MPQLTVVIPARNEAGRIGRAVRTVHDVLEQARIEHEIVVVDDASTDETREESAGLCRDFPLRVLSHPQPLGKGAAVATGFLASTGDQCAFIDADLEFPPALLVRMVRTVEGASKPQQTCAVGVRQEDGRSRLERLTSRLARTAIRCVARLPVKDTQAGIKMFPGWFAREIATQLTERGWLFDVEALLLARRRHLAILAFPLRQIRLRPRRASAGDYLRSAAVLVRLVVRSRASVEVAASRESHLA